MRFVSSRFTLVIALALLALPCIAQDLASWEARTTTRVLDNGLTVIVVERHEAPVFSFFTHVDAGGAQEVPGITGLAHMFEHMAFKGTYDIGTTDYEAEKRALMEVEKAYRAYDLERRSINPDPAEVERLKADFDAKVEKANSYVKSNEFGEIIDRVGGVGLNAFTSSDETGYFYSFPSNRLELWAYLESERFLEPVMREFYKERNVVTEERRMRTESSPIGRLVEQFLTTAFTAHPYGQPVVGWPSDLSTFTATDAMEFYRKYYSPSNMTLTLVGDVYPDEAFPLIEKYFGRLPAGDKPEPLRTEEPKQFAERVVILRESSQPFYIEGYQKPAATHPDDAIYNVMSGILSQGRTSRMYKSLVEEKQVAAVAAGFNNFPGGKYRNLFAFYGVPTPGHSSMDIQEAIREEIEKITTEKVTQEELDRVKTNAKAGLLRGLRSNQGIANAFGSYQTLYGDWRQVFRDVEQIEAVTADDILRVARETFVPENRTVGYIESTELAGTEGGME